jgi:hypothetical protein
VTDEAPALSSTKPPMNPASPTWWKRFVTLVPST